MPSRSPAEPVGGADPSTPARRAAIIGHGVIAALGRPRDFLRVVVAPLWEGNYRVNVLTGSDPTAVRIADSFFVTADDRGQVLESVPTIRKRY
jgi:hypothetical protein